MNISPDVWWGKLDGVKRVVEKTAPTDITILIEGETGTGKRLVAKVIHALSSRRDQPFLPIQCAAVPEAFLDLGVFDQIAKEGTVFFERIEDLNSRLQAKTLRILEENDLRRMGKSHELSKGVRIIASANGDLENAMKAGMFHPKLYFRLCALRINLPPLRERREDIIPLAELFAAGRVRKISMRAKRLLRSCHWPGNVRELKNCIDRAVILGDGTTIQPQDLPNKIRRCGKIIPVPIESLDHMEADHIARVLKHTRGDHHDAARILGITIQALLNKIDKYRIRPLERDDKTLHLYKN